jgi:signal transduction histidine kinase
MNNRKLSPSFQLALMFLLFGTIWVMFTDPVSANLANNNPATINQLQSLKGSFFMLIAAALIYFVSRKIFAKQEMLLQQLSEQKANYKNDLAKEVFRAQEGERMKLGEELHDNINQLLGVVKLYIEHAMMNPSVKDEMLKKSAQYLMQVINEIRALSKSLISPDMTEFGLINSVNELIESIIKIQNISIDLKDERFSESALNDIEKLMLFRIMQEQLNNVLKHAHADSVGIELKNEGPHVSMTIKDDGVGFDMNNIKLGLGLKNIRHRLELFNGEMKLESAPGKGCKLEVSFET